MRLLLIILLGLILSSCSDSGSSGSGLSLKLLKIQGEWLSQCQEQDGIPTKINFKVAKNVSYLRFFRFDVSDTSCAGEYLIEVPGGGTDYYKNSFITENEVGAPADIFTYNDVIVTDETDLDYLVAVIESTTKVHILALGTGGTSPGKTWAQWLEYSSGGKDVSDFVADPSNYAEAIHLTRFE